MSPKKEEQNATLFSWCRLKLGGLGDFLLPSNETGRSPQYAGREDRVYVTLDISQALNCALIEDGMVYRVQPIGRLGPDDNGHANPDYTVRKALILAGLRCRQHYALSNTQILGTFIATWLISTMLEENLL